MLSALWLRHPSTPQPIPTDSEWQILEPLLAEPACHRPRGSRPEKHHRRSIIDAVFIW